MDKTGKRNAFKGEFPSVKVGPTFHQDLMIAADEPTIPAGKGNIVQKGLERSFGRHVKIDSETDREMIGNSGFLAIIDSIQLCLLVRVHVGNGTVSNLTWIGRARRRERIDLTVDVGEDRS